MKTRKYKQLDAISRSRGETNDCSVKAVAMFAGVRYMTAHRALSNAGREDRKGANMITIYAALNSLMGSDGYTIDYKMDDGPKRTANTTARLNSDGGHLLVVRGHIIYSKDGIIHDHDQCNKRRVDMILSKS